MSWLDLPRRPEPEVMDDSGEVKAYSSAAAQAYLNAIDDTFVDHALRLVGRGAFGRALDIGTGPGNIVIKLARHLPGWLLTGVDRSPNMVRQALAGLAAAAPGTSADLNIGSRVEYLIADGNQLPFSDARFDLVTCNSVLHHAEKPTQLIAEMARVAAPDGAILLRDLRRPSRIGYPLHIRWYGRSYGGLMYKLYCDSVRSAYTLEEVRAMLHASPVPGLRVFSHGRTHVGFERPAH